MNAAFSLVNSTSIEAPIVVTHCRESGGQSVTEFGGKMALTSQGTKKKVCYYYDGKNEARNVVLLTLHVW